MLAMISSLMAALLLRPWIERAAPREPVPGLRAMPLTRRIAALCIDLVPGAVVDLDNRYFMTKAAHFYEGPDGNHCVFHLAFAAKPTEYAQESLDAVERNSPGCVEGCPSSGLVETWWASPDPGLRLSILDLHCFCLCRMGFGQAHCRVRELNRRVIERRIT